MATRSTLRLAAALLAAALGATACSSAGEAVIEDVPTAGPSTSTTAPSPQPSSSATTPAPSATATTSAPADDPTASSTSAPPSETTSLTPADDDAGVGVNGPAMLRGDRPTLVLEIDVQNGVGVQARAVDHLVQTMREVVDKPGGIVFQGSNAFDDPRTEWTAEDLRAVAAENRDTATTDEQVSVHVLYVAGGHVEDGEQTNAIGLATSASTAAVFPDRWQGLGSLVGSGEAVERAVLVHEIGHLFGLVNLTYTSDRDHEDPEHPGHSASRDSVMFHAIESTLVGQVFSGPPPDTFDEADRADLEGLKTGRL